MSRAASQVRRSLAAAALPVALSLVACGGASDDSGNQVVPGQALSVASTDGLATGTVRLDGAEVTRGRNTFFVAFDPSTTEVSSASTLMPAHGHGSVVPSLAHEVDGYRISNVVFNMPGLWEVRLELAVDGKTDRLIFSADAP
jgi:hypothetical protein